MHGKGLFTWNDGSQYKGQFCEGFPCGMGKMCLPDMSVYLGNFWRGEFHGFGTLNVTGTKMIYSGNWSDGKKHGNVAHSFYPFLPYSKE